MKPAVSLCLIVQAFILSAASAARAQQRIQGVVRRGDGTPIATAVIILQRTADSTMIRTALTDEQGAYTISAADLTGSAIRATAAGFIPGLQAVSDSAKGMQSIDFTLLPAASALEDVTVSSARPVFERKVDRTIFNVSSSISAIGGNAIDAVKKAPGVIVREGEASVSIVGKTTVQVMVNGRLIQLEGEDLFAYLQAIPAGNLERIEVITTPPAQYDAAGSSGLINIVLKKQVKGGVNGDVRAGYEQSGWGTYTGGGNLNYRSGRLNLYGSGSYTQQSKAIVERLYTYYPEQSYLLIDPYRRDTRTAQYTLGADYEISKSSVAGIQLTGTDFNRHYEEHTDLEIRQRNSNALDSVVHTDASSYRINQNTIGNINYVWTIDTTGKKLTLNVSRLQYNGTSNRNYDTQNYYGLYLQPTGVMSRNQNRGSQGINVTTAQADVELPGKWADVSFGGKLSYSRNRSRNNFLYYEAGSFHDDPAISNEFHYAENIEALYASAKKSWRKWEVNAGLRGEWTQTTGYSAKLAQTTINNYFSLFPTAFIQYTESEDHIFNINYSKRISRPGYSTLDPYRSYSSPYSYIEGNPFLQPVPVHQVEAGYTLKGKYQFGAFYVYNPNTWGQVFFADTQTKVTYVRTEHYGDFHFTGINGAATFNPLKSWETQIQASGNASWVKLRYATSEASGRPQFTGYFVVNNSFSLNRAKTILAQANVFYITGYLNDLSLVRPQLNADAGVRVLLLDKKLSVNLAANDIFRTLKARSTNIVTGQATDSYFDERNVRLSVNYKFGSNTIKARRDRKTGIEEERDRT